MNLKLCLIFLQFLPLFTFGAERKISLDNVDKSKWIDPNDMINFDHSSNRMRSSDDKGETNKNSDDDDVDEKSTILRTDLTECRRNLLEQASNFEKNLRLHCSSSSPSSSEVIIFKHLLSKISNKLGIDLRKLDDDDDEFYFDIKLELKKIQLKKWSKLVGADAGVGVNLLQDVAESLAEIFSRVKRRLEPSAPFKEPGWMEIFQKYLPILNIILLIPIIGFYLIRFSKLSNFSLCFLFFSSSFIASTIWTWMHLYQIKQAEKYARLFQTIPEVCRPKNSASIWTVFGHYLKSMVQFSEPDECTKYQKDIIADPFWEVTPMQAISVTFTKFFFEPLEIIATNLSRFLTAFLKDLPLTAHPYAIFFLLIIIILVFIFVLFVLFSIFGCRMTAFYGLIAIEPSRRVIVGSSSAPAIPANSYPMVADQPINAPNVEAIEPQ